MRIHIVRTPTGSAVDGISLEVFEVGQCYDVGNSIGALCLAEGWAKPVELDPPVTPQPFSADDPVGVPRLDRNDPPNLIKEHAPPFLETAADYPWRRRRRHRRER